MGSNLLVIAVNDVQKVGVAKFDTTQNPDIEKYEFGLVLWISGQVRVDKKIT